MPNDPSLPPLPDAAARAAIAEEVDVNLVVEAAAGTGKTTSLVARILTLFRRGALAGESRLAAVTFTHKAASELRERLERELASLLSSDADLSPEERDNLRLAAAALPECHIGTIHSFCGRLLRERPVEAGVGLNFRELDDDDDRLLRRQAWDEFAAELRQGGHSRLRTTFELFGLDQEALGKGFESFADYPDVDAWMGDGRRVEDIDVNAFAVGIAKFHGRVGRLEPFLSEADAGNDKLIPCMQILHRRWRRLPKPLGLADAFRLSSLFKETPALVQAQWKQFGLSGDEAKDELAAYAAFYAETVRPFRRDCLAAVYAAALAAFRLARDVYDRLRRDGGFLNFQDLLLLTARVLRVYPEVRADLAGRYARLLVDEVQDTDPVQAEIMFLLAADDMTEKDWRRCRPRPGALFVVGDPKQSIYRFRRADIVVYQELKRLLVESGGRELGLTVNFRSQPSVTAWVNRTFLLAENADSGSPEAAAESGKFSRRESPYSPAYRELEPGRPPAVGGFHGVFALETVPYSRKNGVGDREIVRNEAERIASFIRHAVDGGLELPERDGVRPASPGDFMIVTYQKSAAVAYADAVRRLGLPCQVSSGNTLSASPALALLLSYLEALAFPDDPVLLTAVLRGGLFGVDDARLYRWKKAGGGFTLLHPIPEGAEAELAKIFGTLAAHRALLANAEPVLAAERIAEDLGLWTLACMGDDADGGAAALAAALGRLAAERGSIATPGKLAERLEWIMENHEDDPLPVGPEAESAVRVMNLHKTKGLEAPVVFLTSTRTVKRHKPAFSVKRSEAGSTGAMVIAGGEYGGVPLAQPAEWDDVAATEELFLAAERTRLNYVAATRAGAALVVSVHKAGKGWQSAFLPEFIPGETISQTLPEPESPALPPSSEEDVLGSVDADLLADLAESRRRGLEVMLRESYCTVRAKPEGDWGVAGGLAAPPSAAMDMGEILHRLLESDLAGDALQELAAELLRERQFPAGDAERVADMVRAVRASPVWKRARRAERAFREAPYSLPVAAKGGAALQRGVIDLVFREEDGWVIVDYKSERPGRDPVSAAKKHAAQLVAYAYAWERITGERVKETGIYFLRGGEYVRVNAGEGPPLDEGGF